MAFTLLDVPSSIQAFISVTQDGTVEVTPPTEGTAGDFNELKVGIQLV